MIYCTCCSNPAMTINQEDQPGRNPWDLISLANLLKPFCSIVGQPQEPFFEQGVPLDCIKALYAPEGDQKVTFLVKLTNGALERVTAEKLSVRYPEQMNRFFEEMRLRCLMQGQLIRLRPILSPSRLLPSNGVVGSLASPALLSEAEAMSRLNMN